MSVIRKAPSLVAIAVMLSLSACGSGSDNTNPPVFSSNEYRFTGDEDSVVKGQILATDSDGDSIIYSAASSPTNGIFQISSDGNFRYTPNADYYGADQVRVSASNGIASSHATIYFTILNVNDVPVVVSTTVTVKSDGITYGQITATDADNDPLTYSVVTQPENGTLKLDRTTGAFEYTPETLEFTNNSFVVGVTDGIISEPVTATIYLKPSFVTNEDKLNYYYSSNYSHLKQVEQLAQRLNDDSATDSLNTNLVAGYIISGFNAQADEILEKNISTLNAQAQAYRHAGEEYLANGQDALTYLQTAQNLYRKYLAEKGEENISTADTGFFLSLMKAYLRGGYSQAAIDLQSVIHNIAEEIRQPTQTSDYSRLMNALSTNAKELISNYHAEPTEMLYQQAFAAIDLFAQLAEKTGYQTRSNQNYYQVRALHTGWAASYFDAIGATEKAKEYLAKTIAIYVPVNYDSNYKYPAAQYAATSLQNYSIPLQTAAGVFESLYPNAEHNVAFELLSTVVASTSSGYATAVREIARYKLQNLILAGIDVPTAIAQIAPQVTNQTRGTSELYEMLSYDAADKVSAATRLYQRGYTAEAKQILDHALELLASAERYSERPSSAYMLGNYGCYVLAKQYKDKNFELAPIVSRCQQIADTYFPADSQNVATLQLVNAQMDLLDTYNLANTPTNAAVTAAISRLEIIIPKFEVKEQIPYYAQVSSILANGQHFEKAAEFMAMTLTKAETLLTDETLEVSGINALANTLSSAIGAPFSSTTLERKNLNYIKAVRYYLAGTEGYQSRLEQALTQLRDTSTKIATKVSQLSVNEQQSIHTNLLKLHLATDDRAAALALIDSDAVAAAEKITFTITYGDHLSKLEHFPGSLVANVDTDGDGKPNFFLPNATAEQIQASGLVADEDSDGDGVPDAEDLYPLDPSRS